MDRFGPLPKCALHEITWILDWLQSATQDVYSREYKPAIFCLPGGFGRSPVSSIGLPTSEVFLAAPKAPQLDQNLVLAWILLAEMIAGG